MNHSRSSAGDGFYGFAWHCSERLASRAEWPVSVHEALDDPASQANWLPMVSWLAIEFFLGIVRLTDESGGGVFFLSLQSAGKKKGYPVKKSLALAFAAIVAFGVSPVFAQSSPPGPVDGPVASPPGWKCTASGGVVTCVKEKPPQKEN